MAEAETSTKRIEQGLTLIERVVQIRWAYLVISFVLAADCALGQFWHIGLLTFSPQQGSHAAIPVGAYVVFAGGYVFLMAALIPAAQLGVEMLLLPLLSWLPATRPKYKDSDRAYNGWVWKSEAKREAWTNKDVFWAARIDTFEAEEKKTDAEQKLLARVSFACAILLFANYLIAAPATVMGSSTLWLSSLSGSFQQLALSLLWISIALLGGPWLLILVKRSQWEPAWLYHPELASRKREEVRQRQEMQQKEELRYRAQLRDWKESKQRQDRSLREHENDPFA